MWFLGRWIGNFIINCKKTSLVLFSIYLASTTVNELANAEDDVINDQSNDIEFIDDSIDSATTESDEADKSDSSKSQHYTI